MINKKDLGLVLAIIFASVVISGSLVFFGLQLAKTPAHVNVDDIEQAFDSYVKKQQTQQQQAQQKQQVDKKQLASNLKKVTADDHVRGNRNAKVSLVEYSDFECPYCKVFHKAIQQVSAAYPTQVNIVYRHFPLSFHEPMATKEAIASECVNEIGGNDKFWQYSDMVYERTTSNGTGMDDKKILAVINDIGINQAKFQACIASGKYDQKIKQQIAEGDQAGVTGTPGDFLVNNQTGEIVGLAGAIPFNDGTADDMKPMIDAMLK